MITYTLAILYREIAKSGAQWEGVSVAWLVAAFLDAFLFGFAIFVIGGVFT